MAMCPPWSSDSAWVNTLLFLGGTHPSAPEGTEHTKIMEDNDYFCKPQEEVIRDSEVE